MWRGKLDGTGVTALYTVGSSPPVYADRFTCAARDPSGGFYMMATDSQGAGPRLYHVDENASGSSGLTHVTTEPSFGEARLARNQLSTFTDCSLAVSPDGTVFVQTLKEVWRVAPP